ncbi:hypothetical protein HLK59_48290, partial [Streptomyces sp. S3(2020)]|nr:hypothetical protein [Streptomyces sp. S3(2020)]
RFSATPTAVRTGPALPGADTGDVAHDWDVPDLLKGLDPDGPATKGLDPDGPATKGSDPDGPATKGPE